ncbi:unnamed protein product [Adineta steineri]|uniref:Glycosyl transferase CAP10 domain-containing protein n=1 Tax=Adineta steineri TaxID=433720 RepID=A0A814HIX0_9BILA|nr:unnamed protein product [Adineta steineri]
MTKIQLSPNRLLNIRNDLGPFNLSNLNYCYDIVKPFFNFICNNKSSNYWQLSIQSDQHICYQLYSKDKKLDLFSRIHKDLQPFKNRTILLKDIENISNSCLGCHHIQIIQNKLYIVPRPTASNYETRSRSVKLLIKHMMDTFSDIPDLDLFFHVGDAVEQKQRMQQGVTWRRCRKMTLQLVLVSAVYNICDLPAIIVFIIQSSGYPTFASNIWSPFLTRLTLIPSIIVPFAVLLALPELKRKLLALCIWKRNQRVIVPGITIN